MTLFPAEIRLPGTLVAVGVSGFADLALRSVAIINDHSRAMQQVSDQNRMSHGSMVLPSGVKK
ncbi:putative membrane protein [Xanthomonas euvesicatoria pv. vesicatoria str. 85-10]|uniref:Putative membrane protein n=1 Tax=Xanthomonas euvesicatoria pv. vesicatoria (strain 85-10) TaxID=316273 RepID=Q3BST1_XANE5|nr:putative membrane protein [Xanthomonas euvesicatoria pv. vesicatoria str. 85-10]